MPSVSMQRAPSEQDLDAGEMGGTIIWAEPADSEWPFFIHCLEGQLAI